MHPALSVIFFTTLSGAGYGLLAWAGLVPLALLGLGEPSPGLRSLLLWCIGIGLALVTAGFLSSLAHLGKPMRTWRALSQWRSSWMSREGVLAMVTTVLGYRRELARYKKEAEEKKKEAVAVAQVRDRPPSPESIIEQVGL